MHRDERDRLIDECFRLESEYRRNEYDVTDHHEKAQWHAKRWRILERAVALIEGAQT